MIVKITNGDRPGGLAAYLHGPENMHFYGLEPGGCVIGGNVGAEGDRDGGRWAKDLAAAAAGRPDVAKPIWHASLRVAPEDRALTDHEWADVAGEFVDRMGFGTQPWVVVRHAEDHVHVVASRVSHVGKVWSRHNDRFKARRIAVDLEQQWGLRPTPLRSTDATKVPETHQLTQGEFKKAERTATAPERVLLAHRVKIAAQQAWGKGVEGFHEHLNAAGVAWRVNMASTGRVSGYSFSRPGHLDQAGQPVWFKASQLDKSLSWRKLEDMLTRPTWPPLEVEQIASQIPRKRFETTASHQQRIAEAQQAYVAKLRLRQLGQTSAEAFQRGPLDYYWSTRPRLVKERDQKILDNIENRQRVRELQRAFNPPGSEPGRARSRTGPGPNTAARPYQPPTTPERGFER